MRAAIVLVVPLLVLVAFALAPTAWLPAAIAQEDDGIEDLTAPDAPEAAAAEASDAEEGAASVEAEAETADEAGSAAAAPSFGADHPGNQVPGTTAAACRVWRPARREWVCREVAVPAVTGTRCVPVYEDVDVPVYERRCVQLERPVRVPRYETVEEEVTTCRRVPVYEDVEVPVYEQRCVPLTREVCDPCTGEITTVPCGQRVEVVQTGTRTEQRLAGWETEVVPCGTRSVRRFAGWEQVMVPCGTQIVVEQTGMRTERRLTGYRQECVVLRPATTRTVRECVCVPGGWDVVPASDTR